MLKFFILIKAIKGPVGLELY